jgi:S-adenosylmethionine:tRNA ribosyltransferase-isomerase
MITPVLVEDFDYPLPPELIAQHPADKRDGSRLLTLDRQTGLTQHQSFVDLPNLLRPGDLLVFNDSRVIPARLRARKPASGGNVEILLAEETSPLEWWVMLKPGKRVRAGTIIEFIDHQKQPTPLQATILQKSDSGLCLVRFHGTNNLLQDIDRIGGVPLPPYIERKPEPSSLLQDKERYQTIYARHPGSVAAPTAGLHFTPTLLDAISCRGAECCHVTLHVGLGTFAPIKCSSVQDHRMHSERFSVSTTTANTIQQAIQEKRRIISVGTTTVRVLEHLAQEHGTIPAGSGSTSIFLYPPAPFRIVNALITNFHLPKSSLLMLVSAFASPEGTQGRNLILETYRLAVQNQYRFFSYGDAMFIH